MKTLRLMPVLAVAVAATGCAGSSHSTAVQVHGTIQTVGGPAPGAPRPIAGARFQLVGNGTTANVQANSAGRFGAALAPGVYHVEMTGHSPMADGRPLPARPGRIGVRQGSTAPVHLFVDIK